MLPAEPVEEIPLGALGNPLLLPAADIDAPLGAEDWPEEALGKTPVLAADPVNETPLETEDGALPDVEPLLMEAPVEIPAPVDEATGWLSEIWDTAALFADEDAPLGADPAEDEAVDTLEAGVAGAWSSQDSLIKLTPEGPTISEAVVPSTSTASVNVAGKGAPSVAHGTGIISTKDP